MEYDLVSKKRTGQIKGGSMYLDKKLCRCGCGVSMEHKRGGALTATPACRKRLSRINQRSQWIYWREICAGCGHPRDMHNMETLHTDQLQEHVEAILGPENLDCSFINCDCGGFLETPTSSGRDPNDIPRDLKVF